MRNDMYKRAAVCKVSMTGGREERKRCESMGLGAGSWSQQQSTARMELMDRQAEPEGHQKCRYGDVSHKRSTPSAMNFPALKR